MVSEKATTFISDHKSILNQFKANKEDLADWMVKNLKGWTRREIEDFYIMYKKTILAPIPKKEKPNYRGILDVLHKEDLGLENPTPIETMMASELRVHKIKYKNQYPVGKYRLDFAVMEGNTKIDIECDGDEFHKKTRSQDARDRIRDKYLIGQGWTPLRFSGAQITKNAGFCVEKVKAFLRG